MNMRVGLYPLTSEPGCWSGGSGIGWLTVARAHATPICNIADDDAAAAYSKAAAADRRAPLCCPYGGQRGPAPGDRVLVQLDMSSGALRFFLNGQDLGLAAGPPGSGAAVEMELFLWVRTHADTHAHALPASLG